MRDAFGVLFFVSVGMLFDPAIVAQHPFMLLAGLGIVLVAKPLAAIAIVALLGYPARTALTVAIGLAQIGEFSFILSQVARDHHVMPADGHNILVATAIASITINPLLFKSLDAFERMLRRWPALWNMLDGHAARRASDINAQSQARIASTGKPLAIIVGYGPVGRVVDALLRDTGLETVIVDLNMDTIASLIRQGRAAIFGDASRPEILDDAGITRAVHLVVTLPHSSSRTLLVLAARERNPAIEITVRTRYLREREALTQAGANTTVSEEGEAGIALARHVMRRRGVDNATIDKMLDALRRIWALEPP
jgi:CPA2 family monovalent cation:H+ antiporter-2